MSFSIYVTAFENEDLYYFPTEAVRSRFARYIKSEDDGLWTIAFDEKSQGSDMYVDDGSMTDGFAVNRPSNDLEFWKIIAGILRDLPCVLYWPGGGAVMGSLDLLQHLPKSFVKKLGIPWVSTDPERIRQYVWDNS